MVHLEYMESKGSFMQSAVGGWGKTCCKSSLILNLWGITTHY